MTRSTTPTALITGGGSGIGRASALRLAHEQYRVFIADIDDSAAKATAAQIGGSWLHLDVTDPADWQGAVSRLNDQGGRLDALVLNAGLAGGPRDLADLDWRRTRALWSVNVDGVLLGLDALLPTLLEARGTATVVASLAGLTGIPFDPIYAMTKHALVGMVRSAAESLRERGVQLSAICPGLVDTALLGDARTALARAGYPLLSPDSVALAIADAVTRRRTDEVLLVVAGRDPIPYRFASIPGAKDTDGRSVPQPPMDLIFSSSAG